MEQRILALESDMKEVKGSLNQLLVSVARIEAVLSTLATAAEVAKLAGSVAALDARVGALDTRVAALESRVGHVESAINDTVRAAVAKSIGPAQLPAVLGACIVVVGALMGGFAWLATRMGFLHP